MTTPRKRPTKTEKLAAMYLTIIDPNTGKPYLEREWAKTQTAEQIIAELERIRQWDHGVPLGLNGRHHPTNLSPLIQETEHKPKTVRDVKAIAKSKRITKTQEEFRQRILAKDGVREHGEALGNQSRLRSRPMAGSKESNFKKRFDGTVERRRPKR